MMGATGSGDSEAESWDRVTAIAGRLSARSRDSRHDVFEVFDWPAELPCDTGWMSPELLTCYGTERWETLTEYERCRLAQVEAVNFFSLNIHLIKDLIGEVAARVYATRYPGLSEFFHDFIREENEHMWFFGQFCSRYGGRIYEAKRIATAPAAASDPAADLKIFGRILIAEELCDFYNAKMAADSRLPGIVQQINAVHHQEESRHIAFGRQLIHALRDEVLDTAGPETVAEAGAYLSRYVTSCLRGFYSPAVYADAGLSDAGTLRSRLLADEARRRFHRESMRKTTVFFERIGLFTEAGVAW